MRSITELFKECLAHNPQLKELATKKSKQGFIFQHFSNEKEILIDATLSALNNSSKSSIINLTEDRQPLVLFLKDCLNYVEEHHARIESPSKTSSIKIAKVQYSASLTYKYFYDNTGSKSFLLIGLKKADLRHLSDSQPVENPLDLAVWECNIQKGDLFVNDKWASLLGYDLSELVDLSYSTFQKLVHPDDIKSVEHTIQEFSVGLTSLYQAEFRMRHKKGHYIWILSRGGQLSKNDEGLVEWMRGYHFDITERKLQEEENAILAEVINKTDYAVLKTNSEGYITFANEVFSSMTGYKIADLLGRKPGDFLQGNLTDQRDVEGFRVGLKSQKAFRQNILNYRKNGETYFVSCYVHPVFNEGESVNEYVAIQRDISRENENLQYLETFKNTLDQTTDCIFLFDQDTLQFFYVNRGALDMMGYSKVELLQLHPYDIKPEYPEQSFKELIKPLLEREKKSLRFQTFHRTKDGRDIPIEVFLQLITKENVKPHFVAIVQDITERLKAKNELERLSLVASHTTNLVMIISSDLRVEYLNEAFKKKFSEERTDIIGKDAMAVIHQFSSEKTAKQETRKGLLSKSAFTQDLSCKDDSNKRFFVSLNFNPVFDDNGQLTRWILIETDISERIKLEEEIREQKDFLQKIIDSKTVSITIVNKKGKIIFANSGAEKVLGLTKKEVEDKHYNDPSWHCIGLAGNPLPDDELPFSKIMETGQGVKDVQHGIVWKNGEVKYLSITGAPLKYKEDSIEEVLFSITDITERVLTENKLSNVQGQMHSILREMTDVVWSAQPQSNRLTFITPSIKRLTEWDQAYYYKNSELVDWLQLLLPNKTLIRRRFENGLSDLGWHEEEYKIRTKEGEEKWVFHRAKLVYEGGSAVRIDGYIADVSKRKQSEAEIHEYVRIIENQNKRLKDFAYMLSHNIRSHSSNIRGLIDILLKQSEDGKFLQALDQASKNLDETLENLNELTSSIASNEELIKVKIADYVNNCLTGFKHIIVESNIDFRVNIDRKHAVKVVPAYLDSVITNLVTNAIKYSDPKKNGFVTINSKESGKFVILTIEDNGLGIDLDKYGKQIFGMNKTFHNNKDAKGIGLYITKSHIESMGGGITINSAVGQGTTFRIYLLNGRV